MYGWPRFVYLTSLPPLRLYCASVPYPDFLRLGARLRLEDLDYFFVDFFFVDFFFVDFFFVDFFLVTAAVMPAPIKAPAPAAIAVEAIGLALMRSRALFKRPELDEGICVFAFFNAGVTLIAAFARAI